MEASKTLADSLLDDLDDLSDGDEEEEQRQAQQSDDDDDDDDDDSDSGDSDDGSDDSDSNSDEDSDDDGSAAKAAAARTALQKQFLQATKLQRHLKKLKEVVAPSYEESMPQKELENENHQLVVTSNKFLSSIADELSNAHTALIKAYEPKFPELQELLPNPIQYKNAVRTIWNEMDLTRVNEELNQILTSNQSITVSVASSTTSGRTLSKSELQNVDDAATYMEDLVKVQRELTQFVERSMQALAPSICALIGSATAAQLVGLAGGLAELTKIPSCNLQVIGQVKQNSASQAGFSGIGTKKHTGILAQCDLVSNCAKPFQKKALKTVAAKLALSARFDFINVDAGRPRTAATGQQFRQELQKKFQKWQEPDKAPTLKALPKPDLTVKKRRGGKRMRRWKERFEETAMMKQANTRAFSTQSGEYGDDAMGLSMGLLETADNGGGIRKSVEKKKTRQANTKSSRKRAMQMAQRASNTDGLATSVVFSSTTSMELVNPEAQKDRVRQANKKWFSDNAGFQSAKRQK